MDVATALETFNISVFCVSKDQKEILPAWYLTSLFVLKQIHGNPEAVKVAKYMSGLHIISTHLFFPQTQQPATQTTLMASWASHFL